MGGRFFRTWGVCLVFGLDRVGSTLLGRAACEGLRKGTCCLSLMPPLPSRKPGETTEEEEEAEEEGGFLHALPFTRT